MFLHCVDNGCRWFNQNMYFRLICFLIVVSHFIGLGVLNITPQELKANKKITTTNETDAKRITPFIQYLMGKSKKKTSPRLVFLKFFDKTSAQHYSYISQSITDLIQKDVGNYFQYEQVSDRTIQRTLSKIRKKNRLQKNQINVESLHSLASQENLDFIIYGEFNHKVSKKQRRQKKANIVSKLYDHYTNKSILLNTMISKVDSHFLSEAVVISQAATLKMNEQINSVKEKLFIQITMEIEKEKTLLKQQNNLFQKRNQSLQRKNKLYQRKNKLYQKQNKLHQNRRKQKRTGITGQKMKKLKKIATPVLLLSVNLNKFPPEARNIIEEEKASFSEYLLLKHQYNLMSYKAYYKKFQKTPFQPNKEPLSQWLKRNKVMRVMLQTIKDEKIKFIIIAQLKDFKKVEYNIYAETSSKKTKLDTIAEVLEIDKVKRKNQIKIAARKPHKIWYTIGFSPFHQITAGPTIALSELHFRGGGFNLYGQISLSALLETNFEPKDVHWFLGQIYFGLNIGASYFLQNIDELHTVSPFVDESSMTKNNDFMHSYFIFSDISYQYPIIDFIKIGITLGAGYYVSFFSQESFQNSVSSGITLNMNQGLLLPLGIEVSFAIQKILSLHIRFGDYIYLSHTIMHGFYSSFGISFPLSVQTSYKKT